MRLAGGRWVPGLVAAGVAIAGGRLLLAGQEPGNSVDPRLCLPGVVATPGDEFGPALAPQGDLFVFGMSVPRSYAYALMATWRDEQGRWSPPAVLPFSGRSRDFDATFSPDGHRLYFISDRAGQGASGADYDVWVVERSGRTWGAPARLPAPVNTTFDESHAVEVGGGSLYVASDRPGGFGATDIYRIPRTATGFGTPSNLGVGVNSEAAEMEVTVAPDESELVLSSWARPGGDGSNDLYWSRRVAGRWQPVTRLPAPINTSAREYSPSFTPDGQGLLFASERATRPRAIQGTPYAEMRGAWRTVSNGWGNIYLVDRWWSRGGR